VVREIRPRRLSNERRRHLELEEATRATGLAGWWKRWRQSTRRAEARAQAPTARGRGLRLHIKPLYLARGHDGPLRGAPDPAMVVCAWSIDGNAVRTVLRAVVRFNVRGRLPGAAEPDVTTLVTTSLGGNRTVLLAVALYEENGGDDVQRLTMALEHPASLHFVDLGGDAGNGHSHGHSDATPHVLSALECARDPRLSTLSPRGIVLGDGDASVTKTDQWVGGAAVVVVGQKRPLGHRLSLQSIDGRQDWTVEFATTW